LVVVLALLTLFALLALSFAYYADQQAASARYFREAGSADRADVDPELLFTYFLGQLLYDCPDDLRGVSSGLRGHSLSRSLLGMNYQVGADGVIVRDAAGVLVDGAGNALNAVPYNGTGRLHFDPKLPFPLVPEGTPAKDDINLVNYTYFPADKFLRDPERRGWRPGPRPAGAPDNRQPFAGGFNAPYTYPDLNNMFLAAVKADGRVLLPSFHRPWAGFGPLDPGNWRWTSDVDPSLPTDHPLYKKRQPWLKYLVLRPRPADMGPGFPLPEDAGGDVKNLVGAPGGNDSIWLDLGFPVRVAPDGRKYKPLFAPLVMDLDNRVNLNVHGNLRGLNYAQHASHQGWGPWEVNPGQLAPIPPPIDPSYASAVARRLEWGNLLLGRRPAATGRYRWDKWPHSTLPGNVAPGPAPRFYAPADFDGSRELPTGRPALVGRPSAKLRLPGTRSTLPFLCFPALPPRAGYGDSPLAERKGHPLLFDPFRPVPPDRGFGLCNLEGLLRYGDTGSEALASELLRLCPRNFLDPADPLGSARRRRLVTLASYDPDLPGVSPWFWAKTAGDPNYLRLPPREPLPILSPYHPSGGGVPFPPGLPPLLESEFGPDGRAAAALTALGRLDLNRYLPDYPNPDPKTGRITDLTAFTVAQTARQYLAADLFEVLWRATGAGNPALVPPPGTRAHEPARWDALRWLAQLAVNVVDFIDADDYMTPFNWFTDPRTGRQEWVYGTELPRVVLNEAYVEYANVPTDPGLKLKKPRATRLKANVWVELYNPLRDDPPLTAPYRRGAAQLEMPTAGGLAGYGIYRLTLARLTGDLRQPDNVRGEIPPGGGTVLSLLSTFTPDPKSDIAPTVDTRLLLPADPVLAGGYYGKEGQNRGFYVVGPDLSPKEKSPFAGGMETLRRSEMSYVVRANLPILLPKPSLLLQRLACPYLPPQPNPALPLHNPYITVDYLRDLAPNYAADVGVLGLNLPAPEPVAARASYGRKQPYAAHPSQLKKQQPKPGLAKQPQHTFFQHNADATTPGPNWRVVPRNYPRFDWLLHLDRPLITPVELLHVSGFKPHELTQQFRTGDTAEQQFTHRAPWLDEDLAGSSLPQSHRLYRALEFLSTHSRVAGMMTAQTTSARGLPKPGATAPPPPYRNRVVTPGAMSGVTASGGTWRIEAGSVLVIDQGKPGEEVVRVKAVGPAAKPAWFVADFLSYHGPGFTITPTAVRERLPGKVNLNTVWDEETFLALCDPNPANIFHQGLVKATFQRLRGSRTRDGEGPGPRDRPFQSLAAGLTLAGYADSGLQDTLLRSQDPGSLTRLPILAIPGRAHPYETFELLTKVYNNLTTRSNVYAVWLTVGFFEVTDDRARPVKLGPELGRAEGRPVRHRMFAIVDRSVLLANPGPQARFDPRGPLPACATGQVVPHFSIID
jgi:hypothetical protein